MNKLLEYTVEILIAGFAVFFLWGIGYMILVSDARMERVQQECIKAGMQWISGDCIK